MEPKQIFPSEKVLLVTRQERNTYRVTVNEALCKWRQTREYHLSNVYIYFSLCNDLIARTDTMFIRDIHSLPQSKKLCLWVNNESYFSQSFLPLLFIATMMMIMMKKKKKGRRTSFANLLLEYLRAKSFYSNSWFRSLTEIEIVYFRRENFLLPMC